MTSPIDGPDPERRFDELAAALLEDPAISQGTGFGSTPGLRVGTKIFAMLRQGELVVKLPKPRVDELVSSGRGARFDPRHDGRVMKEWVTVPSPGADWDQLAREALRFVRSALPRPSQRPEREAGP
jgi:hypothetical protein